MVVLVSHQIYNSNLVGYYNLITTLFIINVSMLPSIAATNIEDKWFG